MYWMFLYAIHRKNDPHPAICLSARLGGNKKSAFLVTLKWAPQAAGISISGPSELRGWRGIPTKDLDRMDRSLDRADTNLVIYHGNARAMITLSSRCYRLVNNEQVLAIRLLGWVSESKNISVVYRLLDVIHIYIQLMSLIVLMIQNRRSTPPSISIERQAYVANQPNNQSANQITKQTNKQTKHIGVKWYIGLNIQWIYRWFY